MSKKGSKSAASPGIPRLGLILDSSVIIAAERKRQTVEALLTSVEQVFGEIEIVISSIQQAVKGITLPADELLIGASALEQGYAVGTLNVRHFEKITGLRVLFL